MVKAILFDLRDTLLDVKDAYKACGDFLWEFVNQNHISVDQQELQDDLAEIRKEEIKKYEGDLTIHNWDAIFLPALFKKYGINMPADQLTQFLFDYSEVFANKTKLYPDAEEILKYLKEKNIKTGVVIDGTLKRERYILGRTGLSKLVNIITISEEVGKNKFSDLPLKSALQKLGLPAKEVLVIGDRIDKDIIHANRAGCKTAKLERKDGRYTDLSALSDEEKPDFIIHSIKPEEIVPLIS